MLEGPLVSLIRRALGERGAYVVNIHGSRYGTKGTPDLIVCYRGRLIGMEVKTPERRGSATRAQKQHLRFIQKAGGKAGVVTSVADALSLLDTTDPGEK